MRQQVFYSSVEKVEYTFDEADIKRILQLYLNANHNVRSDGLWHFEWHPVDTSDYDPLLEIVLTHEFEKQLEQPASGGGGDGA